MSSGLEIDNEATVVCASVEDDSRAGWVAELVAAAGGELLERGSPVLGLFGDPLTAVDAASELNLASCSSLPASPWLRIGAAHGPCDDRVPSASVMDRARRLCEGAGPGELLVGENVHARIGAERELAYAGVLEPRRAGQPPVPAWRRTWPRVSGSKPQMPLPQGIVASGRDWGVFGRESELRRIETAWARACAGARALVLVGGEPGIGKTRLVAEACAAAHAAGANVLYGRHDGDLSIPHQGLAEALEHLGAHASPGLIDELAAEARDIAAVAPGLARRLGAPTPSSDSAHAPLLAAGSLLSTVAHGRPLVLALEDLHAADRSTLTLLRHVLLGPFPMPMLVLATYRPQELTPRAAGELADLTARLSATEIELTGLDAASIAGLAGQFGGKPVAGSRRLGRELRRDTGGNPLFVTEILRGLDEGALALEPQELPLPRSLRDVIANRVRGLGEALTELLVLAATMGRDFDPAVLADAADAGVGTVSEQLERAESAGILEPVSRGARYRFAHAVIQRSLYDSQTAAAGGRNHRRTAEALERRGEHALAQPGEVARHWLRAVPGDAERAVEWTWLAGEDALARFQPDAAARFFERALELQGGLGAAPAARSAVLTGLGIAQQREGDPRFRETLLEAARCADAAGDVEKLVRATLANTRGIASATGQVDLERVSLLERALALLDPGDSPERAALLAALARELAFAEDPDRRLGIAAEAVEIARRSGSPAVLANALVARFMPTWSPDRVGDRLADMAEALRIADQIGDPQLQFHALHWQGVALIQAGRLAAARETIDRTETLGRRLGDAVAPWLASLDRCTLTAITGTLGEAERIAQRSLELGSESGQPDAIAFFTSQIACIRWHQGRLGELLPLVREAVEANPSIPAFRSLFALAATAAGAREDAARILAAEAADGFARLPLDLGWLTAMVSYGHAAADLGDREVAQLLYERLAGLPPQVVYTGMSVWGDLDWARGRLAAALGLADEAERHLGDSVRWCEQNGAELWHARALLSLATELPGLARTDAAELLADAAGAAARAGASELERRARLLAGGELDDAPVVEPDEARLTPRQIDVMRLVARGRTNIEIAERLGISPATVKRHLEGAYARLGVRTRAEAVARMLRR